MRDSVCKELSNICVISWLLRICFKEIKLIILWSCCWLGKRYQQGVHHRPADQKEIQGKWFRELILCFGVVFFGIIYCIFGLVPPSERLSPGQIWEETFIDLASLHSKDSPGIAASSSVLIFCLMDAILVPDPRFEYGSMRNRIEAFFCLSSDIS